MIYDEFLKDNCGFLPRTKRDLKRHQHQIALMNPKVGDKVYAFELWPDRIYGNPHSRFHVYMRLVCPKCGEERWAPYHPERQTSYGQCFHCSLIGRLGANKGRYGSNALGWKGGIRHRKDGYIDVFVDNNDFFRPMVDNCGYVREHRLVMAKYLGRCLHRWEIVHHKNHNRSDNRINNLQLVSDERHSQITIMENRISLLEAKLATATTENIQLRILLHEDKLTSDL